MKASPLRHRTGYSQLRRHPHSANVSRQSIYHLI